MADLVVGENLAKAWIAGTELVIERGGKSFHLNVAFPATYEESRAPWSLLDEFLVANGKEELNTVANTIFPVELYHPHLGDQAAARLYENYAISMRVHQRTGRGNDFETYFNRLVSYPVASGSTEKLGDKARMLKSDGRFNQLDFQIGRLQQARKKSKRRNSYEIGISHPLDAEARVQAPVTDVAWGSFPCLSHISLTMIEDRLHLTATYRNQYMIERAFGNYVGLARLTNFIANECGCEPGEVQVIATGADAELSTFRKANLLKLLQDCTEAETAATEAEMVVDV
ncbi:MAG: hypothetical protein JWO14_3120 [Solirubrobacterales bacterium]|nr:hypothetical protein [Solirubrobacterales bacterium]